MVQVGYRPMLWHLMRYYAHFGHKDFILCLGWKADVIKEYFLRYDECISNDFVLSSGRREVTLLGQDLDDWRITFVDTGIASNVGQRLRAVREHLAGEETFLANYTDGLTDLHLPNLIEHFHTRQATASFLSVKPAQTFHAVSADAAGEVQRIEPIGSAGVWVNGGFFVFRNTIFDYLREDDELVEQPFRRLVAKRRLSTLRYDGFWSCLDTFKEKQAFDDLYSRGAAPWEVWKRPPRGDKAHIASGLDPASQLDRHATAAAPPALPDPAPNGVPDHAAQGGTPVIGPEGRDASGRTTGTHMDPTP